MTIQEKEVKEVFLEMIRRYETMPSSRKAGRYLQTTRITQWMSEKVGFEIKAKLVVRLFEERGYEFIFEKGGFHHWVKTNHPQEQTPPI